MTCLSAKEDPSGFVVWNRGIMRRAAIIGKVVGVPVDLSATQRYWGDFDRPTGITENTPRFLPPNRAGQRVEINVVRNTGQGQAMGEVTAYGWDVGVSF